MTDKKEKILKSALELFANDGFSATPTSKIAKKAGVSEGLIFRHFESKKGLLQALMDDADAKVKQVLQPIMVDDDPRSVIRRTLEMPFNVDLEEFDYWRLVFKLKWDEEYYNPSKMQPLIDKLSWAFDSLKYPDPEHEARLLNALIETISIEMLRGNIADPEQFKLFLCKKYEV